jgi:hypothetical protein
MVPWDLEMVGSPWTKHRDEEVKLQEIEDVHQLKLQEILDHHRHH